MDPRIPFDCASFAVDGLELSYLDSQSDKPLLHFFHANGFPVSVYLPFMTSLAEHFRVVGLSLRGQDGLSEGITDWTSLALDLERFLDANHDRPVIGVGHSIGAVATLQCAVRRPDLFSHLVLLDPPVISRTNVLLTAIFKLFGQQHRLPLAARARRRRNGWRDRGEALAFFRDRALFAGWQEEFLRSYVTYGLRPAEGDRVALLCPPEAEARAFESYPLRLRSLFRQLTVPGRLIRGMGSDVFSRASFEALCRTCPTIVGFELEKAGHCLPMQRPGEVIREIRRAGTE